MHANSLAHAQLCDEHVDNVLLHSHSHTYIGTAIFSYGGVISMGLT